MGSRRPSITCLSYQGTTGSPKGATLSHYNIVNNSNLIGNRLRLCLKVRGGNRGPAAWGGGSPCWLDKLAPKASGSRIEPAPRLHLQMPEELRMVLPSPLYHCLGSVGGTMVCLIHGATLILASPTFDGKKALEAISKERWASVGSPPGADETLLFLTSAP